jgi:hypothetical protein
MSQKAFYSTAEAAEYLGLSVAALKYHIHVAENIKGHLIGNSLMFTQEQLDEFKRTKRPQGRPPKEEE